VKNGPLPTTGNRLAGGKKHKMKTRRNSRGVGGVRDAYPLTWEGAKKETRGKDMRAPANEKGGMGEGEVKLRSESFVWAHQPSIRSPLERNGKRHGFEGKDESTYI